MKDELKFSEIVARARLDSQTAQYVLKHPLDLTGMPEAGSQGRHRVFSLPQAVRLALCTQLVKAGIALRVAGKVVDCCEKETVEKRGSRKRGLRRYQTRRGYEWVLWILDGEFMRCDHRPVPEAPGISDYVVSGGNLTGFVVIETGKKHKGSVPVPFVQHSFNLTLLENRIVTTE